MVKMSIGDRIKKLRGEMSIADFSEKFGVHRNTLPRYESNDRTPNAKLVASLCKEFDVNSSWLLMGEGPMYKDEVASASVHETSMETLAQVDASAINIQELLNMTAEVLTSDTVYRPALAANIKAFHRSIDLEQDNKELHLRIERLENRQESERAMLETRLRDLENRLRDVDGTGTEKVVGG